MASTKMASKQVKHEPENKLYHGDIWTHNKETDPKTGKIYHVVYKNGVFMTAKEDVEHHTCHGENVDFWQEVLFLKRPHGTGNKVLIPHFVSYEYVNRTVEQMQAEHDIHKTNWEASSVCAGLKKYIHSIQDNSSKLPITNIVYLAVGSFQSSSYPTSRERSHTQLAALNTIRSCLKNPDEVKCVAQEPRFTFTDKEFLKLHGFETVDDPTGLAAIDNGSLVFMIRPSIDLTTIISQGSWPAAFISNTMQKEWSQESKDMIHGCEGGPFLPLLYRFTTFINWKAFLQWKDFYPTDVVYKNFSDMSIYWRNLVGGS